jgi:hypothetical protein
MTSRELCERFSEAADGAKYSVVLGALVLFGLRVLARAFRPSTCAGDCDEGFGPCWECALRGDTALRCDEKAFLEAPGTYTGPVHYHRNADGAIVTVPGTLEACESLWCRRVVELRG